MTEFCYNSDFRGLDFFTMNVRFSNEQVDLLCSERRYHAATVELLKLLYVEGMTVAEVSEAKDVTSVLLYKHIRTFEEGISLYLKKHELVGTFVIHSPDALAQILRHDISHDASHSK